MPEASQETPVSLRGHHLICLQFFRGEGYSPEFVANMLDVIDLLNQGAPVLIISGPDNVCVQCEHRQGDTCAFQDGSQSEIDKLDDLALEHLDLEVGDIVDFREIRARLPDVLEGWRDGACEPCGWADVCLPLMDLFKR